METSKKYQKEEDGPLSGIRAAIKQWNEARKRNKSFRKQKKGFWKGCGKKGDPRYRAENCTDPETKTVAKHGGVKNKKIATLKYGGFIEPPIEQI